MTNTTRVSFLMDGSGSMATKRDMTLSAFGEYIHELQQGDTDITFSLVSFSTMATTTLVQSQPVKAVDIDAVKAAYKTVGGTPLIDAAMELINATAEAAGLNERVIIVIQTDGEENSSTQYSLADLQAKIKARTAAGWQFIFLGADLDAYDQAAKLGIARGSTMSYTQSYAETVDAYRSMGQNTRSYATGQSASVDFTEQQREQAGDKFRDKTSAEVIAEAATKKCPNAMANLAEPKRPPIVDKIKL